MLRLENEQILARYEQAFDLANEGSTRLWRALGAKPGPSMLIYHVHSVAQRTKDVRFVVRRMLKECARLQLQRIRAFAAHDAEPGRLGAADARYSRVASQMDATVQGLKVDFETLFHIGSVTYDHFAAACRYLGARPASLRREATFEFHHLVEHMDSKAPSPLAQQLRATAGVELRWLHYWMRSYRNGFVVHPDRPIQESLVHGGSKFALFTPAQVGWNDDDALERDVEALLPHAPEYIRNADKTHSERARPRALLQRILENIGTVASTSERARIADVARRFGHETPTFQIVASVFADVLSRALPLAIETALQQLGAIDLGRNDVGASPNMTRPARSTHGGRPRRR